MLANYSEPLWVLVCWLSGLDNVKSLTVTASTLQVLSLIPDFLKDKLLLSSQYSRFDDAFHHLSQYSSSFFLPFLQPSSHEDVMADLNQRVQNLKELVHQTKKYIHLAKADIIQKMEEMLALNEHMKMLKKTLDALERQIHEAIKLQQL
ncbi:hypothetical protein P8452_33189 [Trifolium repens]|nr:hypothetical protein P8452_33189 [Trifolium repens]